MYIKIILNLCLVFSLLGCVYANVTAPLDSDVNNTELGSKVGRASSESILFLVAWGDSGVAAAADNGGLTVIKHLDIEYQTYFFGLYVRTTTVAYGD